MTNTQSMPIEETQNVITPEKQPKSEEQRLQDAIVFVCVSRWLLRHTEIVKEFGLPSAILLGMKALNLSPLFGKDAMDMPIQSEC